VQFMVGKKSAHIMLSHCGHSAILLGFSLNVRVPKYVIKMFMSALIYKISVFFQPFFIYMSVPWEQLSQQISPAGLHISQSSQLLQEGLMDIS